MPAAPAPEQHERAQAPEQPDGTEQSDALWIADAKTKIATMEGQIHAIPDTAIIASWNAYPAYVLPATSPTTLSSLLFYYLALPH